MLNIEKAVNILFDAMKLIKLQNVPKEILIIGISLQL